MYMGIQDVVGKLRAGNPIEFRDIDAIAESVAINEQLIDMAIVSDPYAGIALDEYLEHDRERYDLMSSLKARYGDFGARRLTCLLGGLRLDAESIDLLVALIDWFFHMYFADPYLGCDLHNLVIELASVSRYVPSPDEPLEWQSLDLSKFSRLRVSSRAKLFFRQQEIRSPKVQQQDIVFHLLRKWTDYRSHILAIDALYNDKRHLARSKKFRKIANHMSVNAKFQSAVESLRKKYGLITGKIDIKWEFHPSPLWVLSRSARIYQIDNLVPLLVDIYIHMCRDFGGWNWRQHHGLIIAALVFDLNPDTVTSKEGWERIWQVAGFIDPNMLLNVQVDDSQKLASAMLTIAYLAEHIEALDDLPSEIGTWIASGNKLAEALGDVEPVSAIRLLNGSPSEWYSPPNRLTLEITDDTSQNETRWLWSLTELNRDFYISDALTDTNSEAKALYQKDPELFKRDKKLYDIYQALHEIEDNQERLDQTLIRYDSEQKRTVFTEVTSGGIRFVPYLSRKHLEVILIPIMCK